MTWKSYAAVSGAGLLATYLFSTPAPFAPPASSTPQRPVEAAPVPVNDIAEQADRLRLRVDRETSYAEPDRNPFRFGSRRTARPEPAPEPSFVATPEAVPVAIPQPPPIRVQGIATNVVDGVPQRVAILLTPAGFVEAREGDTAGGYRVVVIDEDAVELTDEHGVTRRIPLRP